ncbi:Hypothetical predicted protein [Pelobates cultripes]|uniref:Uncharacterized protein n=1 Tax=Pelobates cultripes TaxID=61616 RepID=A0AAD1SHF5_PELCU|nr:Hypothetical predicted protein [Pelobates cultripes]CAH2299349.1 Hypothetical predicted protein [Pelobates cultripes]
MYLHKSGAQKRKEKREREQEEEKLKKKNPLMKYVKKEKHTEQTTMMQTDSEEDEVHHQEPEKEIAFCSTSNTTDPEVLVEPLQEEMEAPSSVSNTQEIVQEELDWKDPALWPDVLKDKDREKIVIGGLRKEEELKEMIKGMDKDYKEQSFSEFLIYSKSSNGRERHIRD